MDPFFSAISLYRRHNFEKCVEVCTHILDEKPYDEVRFVTNSKLKTNFFLACTKFL